MPDGRFERNFVRRRPISLSELARRLDDCQAMRVFMDNHERVIHAPLRSSAGGYRGDSTAITPASGRRRVVNVMITD